MQFPAELLRQCGFLAGPTACGKTAVSLQISRLLDAEIISLDSMAIYRGMDIGTAKPDQQQRSEVPHHLIDVADPHEEFTVAQFLQMARTAAGEIVARRRLPLFVGGTGLYLRTVLRGLFNGPDADWLLRRQLQADADQHDKQWLHQQLQLVDPMTACRLHPHDTRRIIRALEVFRLTGRQLSADQSQQPLSSENRPRFVVWLEPPRDWLYERINQRVDAMMAAGLLEETRILLNAVPPPGRTARQALGYRELISFLNGTCSLADATEAIRTGTRQFAKRQHTWFRNLQECRPLPINGVESAAEIADRICSL